MQELKKERNRKQREVENLKRDVVLKKAEQEKITEKATKLDTEKAFSECMKGITYIKHEYEMLYKKGLCEIIKEHKKTEN